MPTTVAAPADDRPNDRPTASVVPSMKEVDPRSAQARRVRDPEPDDIDAEAVEAGPPLRDLVGPEFRDRVTRLEEHAVAAAVAAMAIKHNVRYPADTYKNVEPGLVSIDARGNVVGAERAVLDYIRRRPLMVLGTMPDDDPNDRRANTARAQAEAQRSRVNASRPLTEKEERIAVVNELLSHRTYSP